MIRSVITRPIASKLLMLVFIVGGILTAWNIRKEYYPNIPTGTILVDIVLPGAGPQEIERSILMAIENATQGIDGIKRITSRATDERATVLIELLTSEEPMKVLQDVKNAVDSIQTFPETAERPMIILFSEKSRVISLIVHGDQDPFTVRRVADKIQRDLRAWKGITKVEMPFQAPMELSVEISEKSLRQHELSMEQLADRIRQATVDEAGGILFGDHFEIALQTRERKEWATAFQNIVILNSPTGAKIHLADIANVVDGFGNSPAETWFNGRPAIQLDIYATGNESPASVEHALRQYLSQARIPDTIEATIFLNDAQAFRERVSLLIDNAIAGLLLVMIILGLFLSPKLAFWVMMGIPTSLLGGLMLLPLFDATINMVSLFAFIVTVGVVVDDAIMIGESVFHHRSLGLDRVEAVVQGLKEMALPVLLAVSTNIVAFLPMFFIPGGWGVIFRQIPAVVVAVLFVSLIESLLILTCHLAKQTKPTNDPAIFKKLGAPQKVVNQWLNRFTQLRLKNWIRNAINHPFQTLLIMIIVLATVGSVIPGGWIHFRFLPSIDADSATAEVHLPYGSTRRQSRDIQARLVKAAEQASKITHIRHGGIYSMVGSSLTGGEQDEEDTLSSHIISARISLGSSRSRTISAEAFAEVWREQLGDIPLAESVTISGKESLGQSDPVQVNLIHDNEATAKAAAIRLGEQLWQTHLMRSVDDGIRSGKPQLRFQLNSLGKSLGLTATSLSEQIRNRFHGAEALRFQREGNEIKVMVRLTEPERSQIQTLDSIILTTDAGDRVPLLEVADIQKTNTYNQISRLDGIRVYPVTAESKTDTDDARLYSLLEQQILPSLQQEFPGLTYEYGGDMLETDDVTNTLLIGAVVMLAAIYYLTAATLNSYLKPFILMAIIPFGFVGVILGHLILRYDISIISLIGAIALIGVMINDSIVLLMTAERLRAAGMRPIQAAIEAGCRRFRPIILTSLTTFFGLLPLLFETSEQARFMIPMAISISFGLLFSTGVVVFLVPALYQLFPHSEG